MIKRTFKEWNEAGYRIIKGEKAHSRNEAGVPLFTEAQVIMPAWLGDDICDAEDIVFDFQHNYGWGDPHD